MKVRHILGISGGKDSAALAIYLKEKYPNLKIEYYLKSATPFPKCYLQKRNGLLIRKTAIKSSRPFHCAYHPLTP